MNPVVLIDSLGGNRDAFTLLLFVGGFACLSLLLRRGWLRNLFLGLATVFVCLQTISLYFSQSFVGYQFYVHANALSARGIIGLYVQQLLLLVPYALLVFGAMRLIAHLLTRVVERIGGWVRRRAEVIYLGLAVATAGVIAGFTNFPADSRTLFSVVRFDEQTFAEALAGLEMTDYVRPADIRATAGRNVIILSLESLESAFLDDRYAGLTPNLRRLREDWTYLDMEQTTGSEWTSGALYTLLTGLPAFFGAGYNTTFQTSEYSQITSMANVLSAAGYDFTYLNGNANHSGVRAMLTALGVDNIVDKYAIPDEGNFSSYGVRDKDLFDLARTRIQDAKQAATPFALLLSTTDTHAPDGIYDERMEGLIPKQASELEFMVAAVDRLVGDLVTYLETEDLLDNTSVFILPDHLKMGDPTMFAGQERGLYLLTNATGYDTTATYYQIDLPKLILRGGEIDHNQRFLTDYVPEPKDVFIKEHINEITAVNTAGFLRRDAEAYVPPVPTDNYADYLADTTRYIAHAGGMIDGFTYTNSLEALNRSYDRGFRLFELDLLRSADGGFVAAHDWKSWREQTGYAGDTPVTTAEFLRHKMRGRYTPLDLTAINDWFTEHEDAVLVTDKLNEPAAFAAAFVDPDRLMMELFTPEALEEGLAAGIRSAMPTQNVLDRMPAEGLGQRLYESGVRDAAVSRKYIARARPLLADLRDNGIRVYVYNVNFESGIDERYVVRYDFDLVYGMYADRWVGE